MKAFVDRRYLSRLLLVLFATAAVPAFAYRPFDGMDAAVAEEGVFELEAGVGQVRVDHVDSISVPALVFNYGLPYDTEIVLEGKYNRELGMSSGNPNSLGDNALSIKHVFRRGTLQDGEGPSVAVECAVLLPELNGASGTGGECAGIVSNKWEALALHLNAGLGQTREHTNLRTLSLIAEGPDTWKVRPVAEGLVEREGGGAWLNSILAGVIYQQSETLAVDVAFRHAASSEGPINEFRLGLTWSIPIAK